jgi:3D-(3,5/4)-trihydroxycyclohexane-1,2-dione acylhydrolase (decyclizing)
MVGDGSYLMAPGDLATAVAEGIRIVVVLVDNHGYASIGALSRSVGSAGFGTHYRMPLNGAPVVDEDGAPAGGARPLPVDLAANAESLGLRVLRARTIADLRSALHEARGAEGPVAIHIEVDRYAGVPGYEGWWDVPVAEVSDDGAVRAAREAYERAHAAQRAYVEGP